MTKGKYASKHEVMTEKAVYFVWEVWLTDHDLNTTREAANSLSKVLSHLGIDKNPRSMVEEIEQEGSLSLLSEFVVKKLAAEAASIAGGFGFHSEIRRVARVRKGYNKKQVMKLVHRYYHE